MDVAFVSGVCVDVAYVGGACVDVACVGGGYIFSEKLNMLYATNVPSIYGFKV